MPSPEFPSPRIAYDRDGSFAFISRTVGADRSPFTVQPEAVQRLNADAQGGLVVSNAWWDFADPMPGTTFISIVFPAPLRIDAWFGSAMSRWWYSPLGVTTVVDLPLDIEFETSRDTTNGLDGTWTMMTSKSFEDLHLPLSPDEGTGILPDDTSAGNIMGVVRESKTIDDPMWRNADVEGYGWKRVFGSGRSLVRGVRIFFPRKPPSAVANYAYTVLHLHLYGVPEDTATEDRLVVLDALTEEPLVGNVSFGDIDHQDTDLRTIKIQNLSTTLTAEGVEVVIADGYTRDALDASGSLALSLDGTTWGDSLVLGDLAPEEISDEIQVRLSPEVGVIGQRFARIEAEVEEWT